MEIIHERPSQRLHYRVKAPMRVTMGTQSFDTVDWGLGGCRISGVHEFPEVGSRQTLLCTLPFQGFNITLKAEAEVVRLDEKNGEAAFKFVQLGERETALMQHFVEDLVRGKMTDVADTIVRIDTPVTPVPTKPDPNPVHDMPVRRWPVRQIVMTFFYLVLGVLVFGYVGVYTFAALFRLEVETAVVTAERTTIGAPVSGRVLDFPHRAGDMLAAGRMIAVLENTYHEENLRRAKSKLASTRAEMAEKRALVAEEKRRSKGYSLVAQNNVRQAESQLAGLELAKENANLKLERMRSLAAKGLILADQVETAELSLKSVASDLARKKIHIEELKELIDGGNSIRLFTGNSFAGRLAEMEARVARLKAEESYQRELVEDLAAKETKQVILAPSDGILIALEAAEGNSVRQGAPLLVFEETGAEDITAFLTQQEVLQVRSGTIASLFVPSENRWISAEVTRINRTAGFVDEVTQTHRFRSPQGRSAQVTLRPLEGLLPSSGTPVTVYFERYRNNPVFRTVAQLARGL